MKIAIASGKGGTGKTSVAVNLALSLGKTQILDCDVEEPNVHILLKPEFKSSSPVELLVPEIMEERCDYCGECSRFCRYNALFIAGKNALVFPCQHIPLNVNVTGSNLLTFSIQHPASSIQYPGKSRISQTGSTCPFGNNLHRLPPSKPPRFQKPRRSIPG